MSASEDKGNGAPPPLRMVITITEEQPAQLGIRVEGTDNKLLLLGALEMAKAFLVQPQQPAPKKQPTIISGPVTWAEELRRRGKG